jgi:TetR/AcrR family transcriptional regulator, cholesterol catabolism regulator
MDDRSQQCTLPVARRHGARVAVSQARGVMPRPAAPVRKVGRPKGHGPEYATRREAIIDIAAQLFARKGYHAVGIAELCDKAKIGRGSLYYYIGSKEQLLIDIQARAMDPLLANSRLVAGLDTSPVVKLRLVSQTLLDTIVHALPYVWVYEHEVRALRGRQREKFLAPRREFEGVVRGLFAECRDAGLLHVDDDHLATLMFLNLHNHTYQWVNPQGAWQSTELSRQYCTTLFTGMATDRVDMAAVERELASFTGALRWRREPRPDLEPVPGRQRGRRLPGTPATRPARRQPSPS